MEQLSHLFPSSDFALLGVILALPLLGAIGNGLFGKRLGKEAVTLMALSAIGLAFIAALTGFFMLTQAGGHGGHAAEVVRFKWVAWDWMSISGIGDGKAFRDIPLQVAFSVDALNGTMSLIITGIGFLIHLYASKYMEEDPGYYRFFTYLNLFIFSMLVLVLGDSLPVLFVGWEGVGLCSYLLIGFWFSEDANAAAGKKAFITNRIGDFGLLVAMGLLAYYVGALDWAGIDAGKEALFQPVKIWPVADSVPVADAIGGSFAKWVNTPLYVSAATLVGLAIFLGCAGKSAQIPLYVWLPDAMAGPTPVSALIHAATMVTAGVYLICRMSGVFLLSPMAMFVVALTGVVTALFAATIAFVQNDIKKVLAYSTVSQLGFMFLGVGVGAFTAGFFHVMTHAFFKACMFLGSGSVIHAMHARIHGTDPSQDMRHMGGLRKYMPVTFWTFVAGWAAIVGVPLTSGFFSKDEILFKAKTSLVTGPEKILSANGKIEVDNFLWQDWHGTMLYALGACAAIMTAFYMTRLMILTFGGEFRGWSIVPGWTDPHAAHGHDDHGHDAHGHAAHGHDDHGHDDHGHDAHHHHEEPGPNMQGPEPHESPWQMTLPLVVLGALSLGAGFLNAAPFHIEPLHDFLHPLFHGADKVVKTVDGGEGFMWVGLGVAVVLFSVGAGGAFWMYHVQKGAPAKQLAEQFPRLHALVFDKWRIDELYQETVIGALDSLAQMSVWVDKYIVDGILARLSTFLVQLSGSILRQFQTGRLQAYAAIMVLGLAAVGCYVVRPHAALKTKFDRDAGTYALTATPGFGFTYRWDVDGKEGWDSKDGKFGALASASVSLKPDEVRKVKVEVQNPLGFTSKREMTLVRERVDASVPVRLDVTADANGKLRGIPSGPGGGAAMPPNHPTKAQIEQMQRALEQGGH